ncbi:MAG: glutathione S-transferase family protein [Pseudomonadota bacterium]
MQLIGSKKSRAFRTLWMLEELGVTYDHLPAMPHAPEVKAVNPSGKIPALVLEDAAITDSTAILTYLADAHGQFTHPAGTAARGQQDALTCMILDEVDGALWTGAKHSFVLPEDRRVAEVKPTAKWEFEKALARLEEALTGPYLMGDDITVPDFILVHCLGWAKIAGFPEPGPRVEAYFHHARTRDGYKRAAALP